MTETKQKTETQPTPWFCKIVDGGSLLMVVRSILMRLKLREIIQPSPFLSVMVLLTILAGAAAASAESAAVGKSNIANRVGPVVPMKAQLFDLSDVRLLDGPFKVAQQSMCERILSMDPENLLAYSRREAGLPTKEPTGHMADFNFGGCVGHHLSACSMMWQMTGDPRLLDRINTLIAGLAECQRANNDGYCGGVLNSKEGWGRLRQGDVEVIGSKGLLKPVPWYTMHKIYNGLVDAYQRCGIESALPVLIGLSDWCAAVIARLDDDQMQRMLNNEHGGMAESLADVYAITGEKRYLDLARRFRHDLVFLPISQGQDVLFTPGKRPPGLHANTTIPKFTGYQRIYELTGDTEYHAAASNFWQFVVEDHTYNMGGNSSKELFFGQDEWEDAIRQPRGPESCNTYNMLKLTSRLFQYNPQPAFVEFYERAMFNYVLSTVNPRTGGRVYYTGLSPVAYRTSDPERNSCCGFTVKELHFLAHEMTYAHTADQIWVNLFIASELRWQERNVSLKQETCFPHEPRSVLRVRSEQPQRFKLVLRRPAWAGSGFAVTVNGEPVKTEVQPSEYLRINRLWKDGDEVVVELPMSLAVVPLKNNQRFVSVEFGPIVMAASHGPVDFPDSDRTGIVGEVPYGTPEEWPVFVGQRDQFISHLEPVPGESMRFMTRGLIRPVDLMLKPFFETADDRYSVYMPVMDDLSWLAEQERRIAFATTEKTLDARTLDKLSVVDKEGWPIHKMTRSEIRGDFADGLQFWKLLPFPGSELTFNLKVNPSGGNELFVRYWAGSGRWKCQISVNDAVLVQESQDSGRVVLGRFDKAYPIPEEMVAGKQTVKIRIQSSPPTEAPGVVEIRMLAK